jgi:hypothetical protein
VKRDEHNEQIGQIGQAGQDVERIVEQVVKEGMK